MSEPILRVENLNLVFRASMHRAWSWRDLFVKTAKDPFTLLPGGGDRLHILKNVTLDVRSGERVALLGVNGVGKTSLCRVIAGFYEPTSGLVARRGICRALFDVSVGIQPELTGRENAWLLAELLYPGEGDLDELVEEALHFSELGRFLDMPFRLYSKGMQARLGLSMSAGRPADLLILDEVFDGADLFFREKISTRMLELMRDSGAVLFVSHVPDQIRRVCNRLVLLENGTVKFDGDIEEGLRVYENSRPKVRDSTAEVSHFL